MKQLRTIVTVLLALIMALSSVGVFAEEQATGKFSDVPTGTPVSEAVMKLVGYGVITGYEDGTFKPDNTITRAEFAAVITRFKGIANNAPANAVTGFADLDNDESRAWARPYVKAAVDAGIINGFEDGTFRAAEPVTYEQAIKMIVCAIGYEPVAKSEYNKLNALSPQTTTWSSGYIAAASKHGVTKNAATGEVSAPATRGIVAILTSNAYEVPKLETNDKGQWEQGSGTVGDEQYNTQEKIKGTVVANYYTALDETDSDLDLNQIKIVDNENDNVTYEMTDSLRKSVDVEALLGKKVIAYYAKDEFALVSISEDNNSIIEIDEATITRPMEGLSVSYVNSRGKNESVSVDGYTFIYNGKSIEIDAFDEPIAALDGKTLDEKFRNGTIEINETTNVVKINSYEVFVVNSYSKNEGNGKIYLKYRTYDNGEGAVNYYEFPSGGSSNKPQIFVNGTKKDFDSVSLSAYNVINYLESPTNIGPNLRKMYVTTGAKSGKVTAKLEESRVVEINDTEMYLTNDYLEYVPSGSTDKKAPFEIGDNYTYYLDATGQIAAINYSAASGAAYDVGYLIGADDEQLKIIKKDGKSQIFNMRKNVKVDGQSKGKEEVITALKAVVADELSTSEYKDTDSRFLYRQPIKYSLSGGEINSIDTVKTVEGGNDDTFSANALYTGRDVTPGKASVTVNSVTYQLSDSTTTVLYVPSDLSKDTEFDKMKPSEAFAVSDRRKIEVFGADPSSTLKKASLILVYEDNPREVLTGKSPYMIVTRILSDDTIEGYKSGAKEITQVNISEDRYKVKPEKAWVSFDSLEKGDVVRLLEIGGEVIAVQLVYDASSTATGLNTALPEGLIEDEAGNVLYDNEGNYLRICYTEAYGKDVEENKLLVTTEFESTDREDKSLLQENVFVNSSTTYYCYDGNEIVAAGSWDVVRGYDEGSDRLIVVKFGRDNDAATAKVVFVLK